MFIKVSQCFGDANFDSIGDATNSMIYGCVHKHGDFFMVHYRNSPWEFSETGDFMGSHYWRYRWTYLYNCISIFEQQS